jgi:NarL family two-component system response regulator LiaR
MVREGVRAFLETQPDIAVVGEAASGEEAVALVADLLPDVVLMDLLMPGLGGVEATRRIRRASPRTQVVVLTSYHEDGDIFPAIRAGALSYLLKDVDAAALAETVRKAARGESILHPHVAARVLGELRGTGPEERRAFLELSEREVEVLCLVAEGFGNAAIAERLFISEKTVKSHVSNILGKLYLDDRTQAAAFAWREGLVRRPPPGGGSGDGVVPPDGGKP